jgi:hypothetical protein
VIADVIMVAAQANPADIIVYDRPVRGNYEVNSTDYTVYLLSPGAPKAGATQAGTYPTQDKVKANVQYGPSGTDYTGNVTLPGQGDVKNGVQYGSNGTEFTGTLTVSVDAHKRVRWVFDGR